MKQDARKNSHRRKRQKRRLFEKVRSAEESKGGVARQSKTREGLSDGCTCFEVFDDFLREDVGIGKVVGFFEAFGCQLEDIEAGFVAFVKQIKNWTYPFSSIYGNSLTDALSLRRSQLLLISMFQEFPKRFERSETIERLERLELTTA